MALQYLKKALMRKTEPESLLLTELRARRAALVVESHAAYLAYREKQWDGWSSTHAEHDRSWKADQALRAFDIERPEALS